MRHTEDGKARPYRARSSDTVVVTGSDGRALDWTPSGSQWTRVRVVTQLKLQILQIAT